MPTKKTKTKRKPLMDLNAFRQCYSYRHQIPYQKAVEDAVATWKRYQTNPKAPKTMIKYGIPGWKPPAKKRAKLIKKDIETVDDDVKERRQNELMELQVGISYENNLAKIGKTYEVLIEEKDVENIYVGRTYMDSNDIDGCVYVTSDKELVLGNIYKVKINDALEYDLMGDEVDELV